MDGARANGLTIDTDEASAVFELKPNVMAPLTNQDIDTEKSFFGALLDKLPGAPRKPGPLSMTEVSEIAKLRWAEDSTYRPETLCNVAHELDAFASRLADSQRASSLGEGDDRRFYTVQQGDNLGAIAKAQYGDADLHRTLFLVNRALSLHPDEIFPGQELTIPSKEKIVEIEARSRKGS
nr:LysM peptidoglycan-binding domain-containing protein [Parvularcula dongshanensis]